MWHVYLNDPAEPELHENAEDEGTAFGLERHLHDFLRDNWDRMELGRDWTLELEPGEFELGYEYPTGVGRIDLLAKSRVGNDLLVIELKRAQSSDETVGQILRYIGWVRRHVLEEGGTVQGLVIAGSADQRLMYALEETPDVEFMRYRVDFQLVAERLEVTDGKGE